jgi:nitroreductase
MDAPSRGLFRDRFSCRAFAPEPVSRETIEGLLDAARWAPTGGNLQPWRFVVVTGVERKRDLAAAALGQTFIAQAPAVIVVCAVPDISGRVYGDRGRMLYAIQDTAAATENLLLAATGAGLGACWVGAFHEDRVRRALELPDSWRPVALVPLGRPAEAAPRRSRQPLDKVVLWLED